MDSRIVEIYKEGAWQETDFKYLKKGDIFRMFDAPGVPVVDPDGATDWLCLSTPRLMESFKEVLFVNCEATAIKEGV